MIVAVLGASPKTDRYSNKAIRMLLSHGHEVVPIAPVHKEIEGLIVYSRLVDVQKPVDTVTVYVGPKFIDPLIPDIVAIRPRRVILNPGTESEVLKKTLKEHGIDVVEGCTLVMLSTGQF